MPDIEELRKSFKRVHDSSDRLQQEYDLVREAELLNMPLDIYRRLYELSLEEPIPTYPKFMFNKWWKVPFDWYTWLMNLPVQTRSALAFKLISEAIKQGIFISLLIGIIQYLVTCDTRQKQAHDQKRLAHYQAWQIIIAASGKSVSAGRIEALQDLAKDDISLANLSASNAYLEKINLEGADLGEADFSSSNLEQANLSRTNLINANLKGSILFRANLSRANLFRANLSKAYLEKANLSRANLSEAKLDGANLTETNLSGALLRNANLKGNKLYRTNFQKADLNIAILDGANLYGANFQEADLKGASLKGTDLCGTVKDFVESSKNIVEKWECVNFREAKNLIPVQVKTAINWQHAHYSSDFRQQLGLPPE